MKFPVYKTYLEENIDNLALNVAGHKYDQVVIPGQQFQQLVRYIDEQWGGDREDSRADPEDPRQTQEGHPQGPHKDLDRRLTTILMVNG